MAGGITTPELVSAVCNAGGVGSFGFAYSDPERIAKDLIAARRLTAGPINANFFLFESVQPPDASTIEMALQELKNFPSEQSFKLPVPKAPYFHELEQQLEAVWANPPEILTFHFGIPSNAFIQFAHDRDISVGITATNVEEGLAIEHAGADFVVAQGVEAGGHRGTFNGSTRDEELPTYALVNGLISNTHLPVVATGGIMTGQHVRAALELGAVAVQMGTAFLCSDEAGNSAAYRKILLGKDPRNTRFTTGFSGRRARGIENLFTQYMEGKQTLPFPLQNTLTSAMRREAINNGDLELQSLWAGTGYTECRAGKVSDIMLGLREQISF